MAKRLSGCGSGTEYLAVTPWGDFYPCHQFVGNEEFLLGNVDDGNHQYGGPRRIQAAAMSTPRKNARTALPDSTAAAAVRPIPTISMAASTDAYDIGCEMQKKRIECAIMIKGRAGRGIGAEAGRDRPGNFLD